MSLASVCLLASFLPGSIAPPVSGGRPNTGSHVTRAIARKVSGTPKVLGVASDPVLDRDSCTSVRVESRAFWTCRDSQNYGDQIIYFAASTASWSDFNDNGTPKIENEVLSMYGNNPRPYFPIGENECGPGGNCGDGSRWAMWPDSRPLLVTKGDNYSLYTWIAKAHIKGLTLLNPDHPATLYRSDWKVGQLGDSLPPVTVVEDEFWPPDSILYGTYGFVVHEDMAYLYGTLEENAGVALAKVPVGSIEDKTTYSYYIGSGWSNTAPAKNDSNAAIPNAGTTGQGTFYYSDYFEAFAWIGAPAFGVNADFYIATAPSPEGPWTEPELFYSGPVGTGALPAYSQQAHPDWSEDGREIYLTYTKVDDHYSTPLVRVKWE